MISSINLLNRSYGDFVLSGEKYPFETIQLLFSKNQSHIHIIARQGREIPEGVLNLTIYAEQHTILTRSREYVILFGIL